MIMFQGAVNTYCPYYDHESERSITCEGVVASAFSCLKFSSQDKKAEFQKNFCFTEQDYKNCPIAAYLETKYYSK